MNDLITLQNAGVVTAWAAIITVVVAAVCSLWNTLVQRKYHKLSVRPLIAMQMNIRSLDTGVRVVVMLENHGVGPAIITNLRFNLDDQPVPESAERADTIVRVIDSCFSGSRWHGHYELDSYGIPAIKGAIFPNRAHVLAEMSFEFTQPALKNSPDPKVSAAYEAQVKEVKQNISRVDLFLEYESLYGEKHQYSTHDGREKTRSLTQRSQQS